MKKTAIILLLLLVMLLVAFPAFGADQGNQASMPNQQATGQTANQTSSQTVQQGTQQQGVQDFAGIPAVSSDEAMAKAQKIAGKIYGLASGVAPLLTLVILVVGGLLLFISKAARAAIFWAIIGMLVVLWAPQIVGLVMGIIK